MRRGNESGQVAVETAIVLPLFVFMIMGILQLGLMHQARLLAKYAAYKAVRAGSIHNADVPTMEKAALAVLLPMVSDAGGGGSERITPVADAQAFRQKFEGGDIGKNEMGDAGGLKFAEVTICGPLKKDMQSGSHDNKELDFDDPKVAASSGWAESLRTKLSVQVTFNYRMPIPFADMVIYNIARGRDLPFVLRLGKDSERDEFIVKKMSKYDAAASNKLYILPIRATYIMRMHSNFYITAKSLPERNECIFPFEP